MEKIGILVVSYGARETVIVDAFTRSRKYSVIFSLQTVIRIHSM